MGKQKFSNITSCFRVAYTAYFSYHTTIIVTIFCIYHLLLFYAKYAVRMLECIRLYRPIQAQANEGKDPYLCFYSMLCYVFIVSIIKVIVIKTSPVDAVLQRLGSFITCTVHFKIIYSCIESN